MPREAPGPPEGRSVPRWVRAQAVVFGLVRAREAHGRLRTADVVVSLALVVVLASGLFLGLTR